MPAEFLEERADDLLIVFDQAKTAAPENRSIGIAVDRADDLGIGDTHDVLAGAERSQ